MSTQDIYNAIQVNDHLLTSGQPTEDQLKAAAAEGFTIVINLAPHSSRNALPDEAGLVTSLGLNYHNIPVDWSNPTDENFVAFDQTMSDLANSHPDDKTLIHCQANYRVTAFYSLYAQKRLGWSQAQAEAFRAQIWKEGDDPTWLDFIDHIAAQISAKE